jgi:hypothetical protein
MSDATDSDDDDLAIPEADPAPRVTPGSASWAERTGTGAPPYEESREQLWAKWKARILAATPEVREVHLEARRKRLARIAQRREAAAHRARGT